MEKPTHSVSSLIRRPSWLSGLIAVFLVAGTALWTSSWESPARVLEREGVPVGGKIDKSDAEWRGQLTDEQYRITRLKGTERAFTGCYWNTKQDGIYECVCCGQPLFESSTKFDSGTGWPSFWKPLNEDSISLRPDHSLLAERTEVVCSRCNAHLGHVFEDGPRPTGLRFCMNSAALKLMPAQEGKQ